MTHRTRVIVMAAVLGLVAMAGAVWLTTLASRGGESAESAGNEVVPPAGQSVTGSTALQPSATESASASVSSPAAPEESVSPSSASLSSPSAPEEPLSPSTSSGSAPESGPRSIRVNGIRLDGNGNGDGCVTIINKTSTPAFYESVTFTLVSGPQRVTLDPDTAHCVDPENESESDPPCTGLKIDSGRQCIAGVRIPRDAKPGRYLIQPVVHYRYSCISPQSNPCNYPGLRGMAMSPDEPLEVTGATSENVPQAEIEIGDVSGSEQDGTPTVSATPDAHTAVDEGIAVDKENTHQRTAPPRAPVPIARTRVPEER